jgi:cytochrome c553
MPIRPASLSLQRLGIFLSAGALALAVVFPAAAADDGDTTVETENIKVEPLPESRIQDGRIVPADVPGNEVFANGDPEKGRVLYEDGITANGEPLRATTKGDVSVSGTQFSCVNCHRPSGMGSSEGGNYVPPITGSHVFNKRVLNRELRNERFKEFYKESQPKSFWVELRQPRLRPAYTNETLANAIRGGVAPTGRELASIMPRYDLSDRDMANLIAYMRTISVEDDPGVGEKKIHLATIVSDDTDPTLRDAFLKTINIFAEWTNKDLSSQIARPNFSPYYRSEFIDSFKLWEVHTWRLEGPQDTWPEQLEAYYAEQPVFAAVSGLVKGAWKPVGDFCDAKRLPCVFPNTMLPRVEDAEGNYTLYFSGGLHLEGEVLSRFLAKGETAPKTILQLRADSAYGRTPAGAFAQAAARDLPETEVETRGFATDEEVAAAIAEAAANAGDIDTLVIWPGDHAEAAVEALNRHVPDIATIALPSPAFEVTREKIDPALHDRVRLTFPYEKPSGYHPRSFRVRAWMRSRGLPLPDWRMQYQTYYALTMLQYGFEHLLTDFYRDYLIEIIEHEAENKLNPGTHPNLALGPGQRFASKGAHVIALDAEAPKGHKAVSGWIVP